jgi:hypothetical protein
MSTPQNRGGETWIPVHAQILLTTHTGLPDPTHPFLCISRVFENRMKTQKKSYCRMRMERIVPYVPYDQPYGRMIEPYGAVWRRLQN